MNNNERFNQKVTERRLKEKKSLNQSNGNYSKNSQNIKADKEVITAVEEKKN